MARNVLNLNAFEGSVGSIMRMLSQYPVNAKVRLESEQIHENGDCYQYFTVEFDEFAKTIKDAEVERSWRENPDRMGGCFTDEEIAASGRDGYGWY